MGALIGLMFAVGALFAVAAIRAVPSAAAGDSRTTNTVARPRDIRRSIGCSVGCAAAAFLVTQLVIAALLAGAVGATLPGLFARRKLRKAYCLRQAAWPDVVDSLVSAVRAGMSLPEAVCAVTVRGPDCLREPFAAFAADYRASGRFEACLFRLRDGLADPVADRITEALLAARDVGGTDLGRMLRTLSEFLRQDLRLRGEAEVRRGWTLNGARLAVAAPWIVLVMLSTRPGTVDAYRSLTGMLVLVVAAVVSCFAYWLMATIGRLPQERRILL